MISIALCIIHILSCYICDNSFFYFVLSMFFIYLKYEYFKFYYSISKKCEIFISNSSLSFFFHVNNKNL